MIRVELRALYMYRSVSVYQATHITVDRLAMALVRTSKLTLFSRRAAISARILRNDPLDCTLRQLHDTDNLWRTFHGPRHRLVVAINMVVLHLNNVLEQLRQSSPLVISMVPLHLNNALEHLG